MSKEIIAQFLTPRALSSEESERLHREYREFTPIDDAYRQIFVSLHTYFVVGKKLSVDEIVAHYGTYWVWYVDSLWQHIYAVKQAELAKVLGHIFVTSHQLGIDVKREVFYYLRNRGIEGDVMLSMFGELQRSVIECKLPINPLDEHEDRTIGQLVKSYTLAIDAGSDAVTELVDALRSVIFSNDEEPFRFDEEDQTFYLRRLLSNALYMMTDGDLLADISEYFDRVEGGNELVISPELLMAGISIDSIIESMIEERRNASPEVVAPTTLPTLIEQNRSSLRDILMQTGTLRLTLAWLAEQGDRGEAWHRLLDLLKTHALHAIRDAETAGRVIEFSDFLHANGYSDQYDLVYYDESTGRFEWHA
jgi:hypothetical protein